MNTTKSRKKIDFKPYIMVAALLGIWIVLTIASKGNFITPRNLSNLLRQMSVVGLLAIGMVYVLLVGNIDLSVGCFVTFGGVIGACLMVYSGWGAVPSILVMLAAGVALGFIHGFVCTRFGVPAFIVTLSTQMMLRGLYLAIGKGVSIAPLAEGYKEIGQGNLPTVFCIAIGVAAFILFAVTSIAKRRRQISMGLPGESMLLLIGKLVVVAVIIVALMLIFSLYEGMPVPFLILILFTLILQFVAEKTRIGRHMYAVGGNRQAAFCAGVSINKTVIFTFVICSFMAAVAAVVMSARLNCGSATAGDNKELDGIAAAVIGGCSLNGGKGRVMGAILGALIMASLDNGMSLLNVESYWQFIVKGAILVIAVSLDTVSTVKKGK